MLIIQIYYFFWYLQLLNTEQIIDTSSSIILISNLTQQIRVLQTQNANLTSQLTALQSKSLIPEPTHKPTDHPITHNHKHQKTKTRQTLNIVIIGCGNYCYSSKMLIISIMLFGAPNNNKHNCIIHLVTDSKKCSLSSKDSEMLYIKQQLSNLNWLKLNIIQHQDMTINNTFTKDFMEMEDLFHKCAAVRIFLPEIDEFHAMKYIFYMDSDILCFKNITEIINEWTESDQENIISAMTMVDAEEDRLEGWYVHKHYPFNDYYGNNGLNSGVMYYNLDKARNESFVDEIVNIYHWQNMQKLPFYYRHSKHWHLGDQDLLNYYFAKHTNVDKVRILECEWNVRLWRHCYKRYQENKFILHGRSQMFIRTEGEYSKFNNTYGYIKEVYDIDNLDQDIAERDKLRSKLLHHFRKKWIQYHESERLHYWRIRVHPDTDS